jgi:hypothetical protein
MASPTALANPDGGGVRSFLSFTRKVHRTLSERTGRNLDTLRNANLGVTGGDAVELTELYRKTAISFPSLW